MSRSRSNASAERVTLYLPEADTVWRRLHLDNQLDGEFRWTYPSKQLPVEWEYWPDRKRWIDNGLITDPGTPEKPPTTADSEWGTPSGLVGVLALVAGEDTGRLTWATGEGLGRHYLDLTPDQVGPIFRTRCVERTCSGPGCPNPYDDPLARLRWCLECGRPIEWWNGVDPVDVLAAPSLSGEWGLVDTTGSLVILDDVLTPALQAKLSDPEVRFVPAVEPNAEAGEGQYGPQALFVRNDGTAVVERVYTWKKGFGTSELLPEEDIPPLLSNVESSIPPREGFGAAFSRVLRQAFIVGGHDIATGQLTHDMWVLSLDDPPREVNVEGYQPERVLAATLSTTDHTLWVLDDRPLHGKRRLARLVRLDILEGGVEVVWQGPRLGLFDKHWLTMDRDGQVLLFGTSTRLPMHFAVRFEAIPFSLGTAKPVLLRFDKGQLMGEPLVDSVGYQFVVRKGRKRIRSYRIESLEQDAWHTVDLSRCM